MKRVFVFLLCIVFAFSLVACADRKESDTFFALDTYCTFTVYGSADAIKSARARLAELENLLCVTDENSALSRINRGEETEFSPEILALIQTAQRVTIESDGAFDVTVSPLVDAYGFYTDEFRVPTEAELEALVKLVDGRALLDKDGAICLQKGQKIDLGGIAKGYIADACAAVLREQGVKSAILSLGGNVCAVGNKPDGKPFNVAVSDPKDTSSYVGTVLLSDASLVTAGSYQRGFTENGKYYHHILDPKTGKCADSGLGSVTVLCRDGARADALSTACFVLGEEGALTLWESSSDFELLLVREDGTLVCTEGLRGIFTPQNHAVEWRKKN